MSLLDSDRLFQALLERLELPGATVVADLDFDSFDDVPLITHRSFVAQEGNGRGIWRATLTINAFVDISSEPDPWTTVIQPLYDGIHAWGDSPLAGVIDGVGAVSSVDRDIEALNRHGNAVELDAKSITTYTGSFELTIRA
ncbi:hypothetical protein [Microbacterium binotii]|uniref:DUF3168 domain-containing protein n=1 Tax=Microbacterium binotii TaxID=462710 RepID=A0ABP6BMK7_9MICO